MAELVVNTDYFTSNQELMEKLNDNPVQVQIGPNGNKEEDQILDQSGIMMAAPASWVQRLLERNDIKSEAIPTGKFVIR